MIKHLSVIGKLIEQVADKVRPKMNREKAKIVKLLENESRMDDENYEDIMFEKVNEFQYLGVMLCQE